MARAIPNRFSPCPRTALPMSPTWQRPCAAAGGGGRRRQNRRHRVPRGLRTDRARALCRARRPRSSCRNSDQRWLQRQGPGAIEAARSCSRGALRAASPFVNLPARATAVICPRGRGKSPPRRNFRAHRLAVQDVALSRRKQGFDSPWARQWFQWLIRFSCFGLAANTEYLRKTCPRMHLANGGRFAAYRDAKNVRPREPRVASLRGLGHCAKPR